MGITLHFVSYDVSSFSADIQHFISLRITLYAISGGYVSAFLWNDLMFPAFSCDSVCHCTSPFKFCHFLSFRVNSHLHTVRYATNSAACWAVSRHFRLPLAPGTLSSRSGVGSPFRCCSCVSRCWGLTRRPRFALRLRFVISGTI